MFDPISIFETDSLRYWFFLQVIFVYTEQNTKLWKQPLGGTLENRCSVGILKYNVVIRIFSYDYEYGNKLLRGTDNIWKYS